MAEPLSAQLGAALIRYKHSYLLTPTLLRIVAMWILDEPLDVYTEDKAVIVHALLDAANACTGAQQSLRDVGLPAELLNPLLRAGLSTISSVKDLGVEALPAIKLIGPTRAAQIMNAIEAYEQQTKPALDVGDRQAEGNLVDPVE
jgi:hypothetical protein